MSVRSGRAIDVVCMGRAAVDLYGEQIGGRLEDMRSFARYLGGSPANTAVGVARLGLKPAMLTRVGDEHNGRFVRERLAAEGVDVSHVSTDPKRLTALVFLGIRDRETFPLVFYREHCADMGLVADDVDPALIAARRALLLSGTHLSQPGTLAACRRAIALARASHTRIVLDIDYRPVLWGLTSPGLGEQRYVASERVSAVLQGHRRRLRPARRHRGGDPHRRRLGRHPRRLAPPARAHHGDARRQARADGLRRLRSGDPRRHRGRPQGPGLSGRGVQHPRRRRRLHGRLSPRLARGAAARRLLRLRQRLRRARRLAPRLRAGDAELDRAHPLPRPRLARAGAAPRRRPRAPAPRHHPPDRVAGAGGVRVRPPGPARGARRNRRRCRRPHRPLQVPARRGRAPRRRERAPGRQRRRLRRDPRRALRRGDAADAHRHRRLDRAAGRAARVAAAGVRGRPRPRAGAARLADRARRQVPGQLPPGRSGRAARGAARAAAGAAARLRRHRPRAAGGGDPAARGRPGARHPGARARADLCRRHPARLVEAAAAGERARMVADRCGDRAPRSALPRRAAARPRGERGGAGGELRHRRAARPLQGLRRRPLDLRRGGRGLVRRNDERRRGRRRRRRALRPAGGALARGSRRPRRRLPLPPPLAAKDTA